MSGWQKFHIYLIASLAGFVLSAGANAAVLKPQLDIAQVGSDAGLSIAGDSFVIDASVIQIILESGTIDLIPDESFTLNADTFTGLGSLDAGTGGSLLKADLNNLTIIGLGDGINFNFTADLSYVSGSMKGSLTGGNILGAYQLVGNDYLNVTAKVGPVVPVPAAVWLFGSGLIGLIGVARRKTA